MSTLKKGEHFMTKRKLCALLLAAGLMSTVILGGCGGDDSNSKTSAVSTAPVVKSNIPEDGGFKTVSYESSKDKFRTFYEIFPYSFYDSDGNGKGDLKGITQHLDYLNDGDPKTTEDLGIDGIWLTPIMQSPSYHKYDVQDYYTVDEIFGTNDDFKTLLDEAHKRGINVIIDLVINHSSSKHEWFRKALDELKEGKTDGYAQYYHFEKGNNIDGWSKANVDDWYYESNFVSEMPDLNLKNPELREELKKITKYWLDMGVDGFRLDAVLWFESVDGKYGQHDNDSSIEDLKWLYDYAKSVKEDVYMVGECWTDSTTIAEYYKSGVDSFFNFKGQGSKGSFNLSINGSDAAGFVSFLESWQGQLLKNNPNAIDAKFLSNHDTVRSAEFITNDTKKRLAAAMYILAPGNPFIYYGEEIEMDGVNPPDPDVRRGMLWSTTDADGYVKKIPGGTKMEDEPTISVESSLKNDQSLMSFYKRAIVLRNQNPEIARGTIKALTFEDKKGTAGFISTYKDSSVLVMYNLGETSATVTIPSSDFKVNEMRGYILAHNANDALYRETPYDDSIKLDGQTLTMPAHSVFVLK